MASDSQALKALEAPDVRIWHNGSYPLEATRTRARGVLTLVRSAARKRPSQHR